MSKKRDHKKRVYTVILSFLAVLFLLARVPTNERLTAHAAGQKSRITKQVNTYMSALKRYDIKKIRSMQVNKDVYHITDKRLQKYIRKANKENLSYEIKRIKTKGSSATVYMHVRFYSSQGDFENAIKKILWDYKRSWSGAKFGKELYEWLSWAYDPEDEAMIFEQNIKVSMTKKGNKWMINKMNDDLFFIKDAGLTYFMDDFVKHPKKYI